MVEDCKNSVLWNFIRSFGLMDELENLKEFKDWTSPELVDRDMHKKKDKSMTRKTQYDAEFKKSTVELLIKSRKSMTQISKDLGVSLNTLGKLYVLIFF